MKKQEVRFIFVLMFALVALVAIPGAALAASQTADVPASPLQFAANCPYTVRYGDTLFRIALRSGTNVYTLAAMNGIYNANLIYSGMALRVPCSGSPAPAPVPAPNPSGICTYYIVRPGDYLTRIAAQFGTTWQAIAQGNHLSNPSLIYAGMRLGIPCGSVPSPDAYQWKTFTSYKHHYTINYPADWTISVQTPNYGGEPENVFLRRGSTGYATVELLVLKGSAPITGYDNCNKNVTIQGVPACSISLSGGQYPATRLLVFQKGDSHFHLALQDVDQQQLAAFEEIVKSIRFTQ